MRGLLAGGIAIASLSACTHVAPVRSPLLYVSTRVPPRVWVVRARDDSVIAVQPRAQKDRLIGFVSGRYREIPATDIKELRAEDDAAFTRKLVVYYTLGLVAAYEYVRTVDRERTPNCGPAGVSIPGGGCTSREPPGDCDCSNVAAESVCC